MGCRACARTDMASPAMRLIGGCNQLQLPAGHALCAPWWLRARQAGLADNMTRGQVSRPVLALECCVVPAV